MSTWIATAKIVGEGKRSIKVEALNAYQAATRGQEALLRWFPGAMVPWPAVTELREES